MGAAMVNTVGTAVGAEVGVAVGEPVGIAVVGTGVVAAVGVTQDSSPHVDGCMGNTVYRSFCCRLYVGVLLLQGGCVAVLLW